MIRFLIRRPVAVLLTFLILSIFGFLSLPRIPVSLLPDVEIPKMSIKVSYPNNAAALIEKNVTSVIRENLEGLNHLKDVETESSDHSAVIHLNFEYGTKMNLAYMDLSEKLDRLTNSLPRDLIRPEIIRVNTSDVPIIRLQIIPKDLSGVLQISQFTEKIIRKRLEKIDGVSIIDINGAEKGGISIVPDLGLLRAVGLDETDLTEAIKKSNSEFGGLIIKDGGYQFFVKVKNSLRSIEELEAIPLFLKDGRVSSLGRFAKITFAVNGQQGFHVFNGSEGLVINIHKQADAKMNELVYQIKEAVKKFRSDYPLIEFKTTQDQSYLLSEGINNLNQDLIYGGIFCILLLFLFLGNYASPILMGISIPLSLVFTFVFFYLFDISFNIISLSGLALGIGMLIDNSIIVVDNITRKRRAGLTLEDSCVFGTNEVISPILSNVLTTFAIYAPMIFISGLAGSLIFDQAVALTISLGVSLLVAFGLTPLLYKKFLDKNPDLLKEDTKFYKWISSGYHRMITIIFRKKRFYFILTILIMPIGFILLKFIPVKSLPHITSTETTIDINWGEQIDAFENLYRIKQLGNILEEKVVYWESDIGIKQYILPQEVNNTQSSSIYYKCKSEILKQNVDKRIRGWLAKTYPQAIFAVKDASNAFTQLFQNNKPYLEARFRNISRRPDSLELFDLKKLLVDFENEKYTLGSSFLTEENIELTIDEKKLITYGIEKSQLILSLKRLFGNLEISKMTRFGETTSVFFKSEQVTIAAKLNELIGNDFGGIYPIRTFVKYTNGLDRKYISADRLGEYRSIYFDQLHVKELANLKERIVKSASRNGLTVDFSGKYEEDSLLFKELLAIFLISLVLLYFILAIQFENLLHPLIVMFTIPLGITGAMVVLWISGGGLDIMSAIGFVVVLGIIVDDPSLKIETINRIRKELENSGETDKREILLKSIHAAGEICLKPLLMVSLTTTLALVPVFFTNGIGNELQRPLVYVIVGGLSLGTFFTLWFIPLAYWFLSKKK